MLWSIHQIQLACNKIKRAQVLKAEITFQLRCNLASFDPLRKTYSSKIPPLRGKLWENNFEMKLQITNNAKRHHSIEKRYFTVCMHAVVFDTFDSATRIVLCLNGCSQIKWSTSNTTLHSLSWRFPHAVYKLFCPCWIIWIARVRSLFTTSWQTG